MSAEDRSLERRRAYSEYIKLRNKNKGNASDEMLEKLAEAFNVTEDDIKSMASDISIDGPVDVRIAQFMLIMEDLRDYRDAKQIKSSRQDILKAMLDESDSGYEEYLFLG